jgi:uncharacterized protein (TIGR02145 family)
MRFFNRQGWGRALLLAAAMVGAVFAEAQEAGVDTAYVPFVVNIDAAVTAQLKDGATLISLAQMSAAAGDENVSKIPLSKPSGVGVRFVAQRRTNAPALISNCGGKIALNLPADAYKKAEISLYAVNGKRILRKKIHASGAANNMSLPNVAPGAYLLSVKGTGGNAVASRLTHGGGSLAIKASFVFSGSEERGAAPAPRLAKEVAAAKCTVTVSAGGYVDTSYTFTPTAGTNPSHNITLREAAGGGSGMYAVKVSSLGAGASGSGNYAPGATVSINAGTAPDGFRFKNWTTTGGMFFTNANKAATTFMMPSAAVTVIANFEPDTYILTVLSDGDGATESGERAPGRQISINAGTPPEGLYFKKWTTESGVTFANANSATTTFTMPASAVTVTASFEPKYTVTLSSVGTGASVNGSEFFVGATVLISAGTAPTEQRFNNWTSENGDVTFANVSSATTTFTMPASDVTVTANFGANTFRVTVRAGADATGEGDYLPGATVNIKAGISPNGDSFVRWTSSHNGLIFADAGSATTAFIMPPNAVTVTAGFGIGSVLIDSRDEKAYGVVTIDGKKWMTENLNYGSGNGNQYGKWYTFSEAKTACPSGWHLPTRAEWSALVSAVGSPAGTKLKSVNGWDGSGNGTDDYGFSAMPGDYRTAGKYQNTPFAGQSRGCDATYINNGINGGGYWWTATAGSGSSSAYYRSMSGNTDNVVESEVPTSRSCRAPTPDGFAYGDVNESIYLSVRCVAD